MHDDHVKKRENRGVGSVNPVILAILDTIKQVLYVPVNSKTAHPPPPGANPGAFDFFEKFWSNSPLYCQTVKRPTRESFKEGQIPHPKAPFIWRKVVPGKRVTLLAESTLPSVYMRKTLTPLPEPRAENRARACSECLALTKLTRLGEPKCLYGKSWPG